MQGPGKLVGDGVSHGDTPSVLYGLCQHDLAGDREGLFTPIHGPVPPGVRSGDGGSPGFFMVSSWFLTTTAIPGRNAGGIPEQPGSTRRRSG